MPTTAEHALAVTINGLVSTHGADAVLDAIAQRIRHSYPTELVASVLLLASEVREHNAKHAEAMGLIAGNSPDTFMAADVEGSNAVESKPVDFIAALRESLRCRRCGQLHEDHGLCPPDGYDSSNRSSLDADHNDLDPNDTADDRAPCKRCGGLVVDAEYTDNGGMHAACAELEGS